MNVSEAGRFCGDPEAFRELFPASLILSILAMVRQAWANMPRPAADEIETSITYRLLIALRHEKRKQPGAMPCRIHRETPIDPMRPEDESYRIDITFLRDEDEDVYFAIEAKRLNVKKKKGKGVGTLAREYISQGVMRYGNGYYSPGLPSACMLGVVMDGRLHVAIDAINGLLPEYQTELAMQLDRLSSSTMDPAAPDLLESNHDLVDGPMCLQHLFLSGA